jgi:hypothetical protein
MKVDEIKRWRFLENPLHHDEVTRQRIFAIRI